MLELIRVQAKEAVEALLEVAFLKENDIFVVGCSTSEVLGEKIGTFSNLEIATAIFEGIYPVLKKRGIYLAAQCCEHLNRALILEEEAAVHYRYECVNVVPMPKAGGSFGTVAYDRFENPVAVEHITAKAGIDIGDTLIGMHLQQVAVPVRFKMKQIGKANLVCARSRSKFIGGQRANYNEKLL